MAVYSSYYPSQASEAQQTDIDTFNKFFDVDISSMLIPETVVGTDARLSLCLVRLLNNIIKLILAGALLVILPLKTLFTIILALLQLKNVLTIDNIKRKMKELSSIKDRFKMPKKDEVNAEKKSKKDIWKQMEAQVVNMTQSAYNTAITESERNLNSLKDTFKAQYALPDCLIHGVDLDKPIKIPRWGDAGDSAHQAKAASSRTSKLEATLTSLYNQVKKLQQQMSTITKMLPLVDKVQNLMNLKVGMK